jgi:hypothetical protein
MFASFTASNAAVHVSNFTHENARDSVFERKYWKVFLTHCLAILKKLAFFKIAFAGSKGSFAEARAQQSWGGRHQARTKGEPGRPVIPVL